MFPTWTLPVEDCEICRCVTGINHLWCFIIFLFVILFAIWYCRCRLRLLPKVACVGVPETVVVCLLLLTWACWLLLCFYCCLFAVVCCLLRVLERFSAKHIKCCSRLPSWCGLSNVQLLWMRLLYNRNCSATTTVGYIFHYTPLLNIIAGLLPHWKYFWHFLQLWPLSQSHRSMQYFRYHRYAHQLSSISTSAIIDKYFSYHW